MVRDQSNATFVLPLTYLHVVYLHPVLSFFQLYLLDYLLYLIVLLRLSTSQTPHLAVCGGFRFGRIDHRMSYK